MLRVPAGVNLPTGVAWMNARLASMSAVSSSKDVVIFDADAALLEELVPLSDVADVPAPE